MLIHFLFGDPVGFSHLGQMKGFRFLASCQVRPKQEP